MFISSPLNFISTVQSQLNRLYLLLSSICHQQSMTYFKVLQSESFNWLKPFTFLSNLIQADPEFLIILDTIGFLFSFAEQL